MDKKRILSGITSTGKLTLGNYIGALQNFVKLQDEFEMYIFVANLHGITMPIEKEVLRNNIKTIVALYFACGLDPKKANVFLQSDVSEHSELGWILTCNTTLGELQRMTQFKDKSAKAKASNGTDFIPTGLLVYPALMAADILLYDADYIPVGADQKQHVELTRNIVERMNNKFGPLFKMPEVYTPKVGARIMDLQDPTSKMSKSAKNEKGVIFMLDDAATIQRKIKSAITDSDNLVHFDPENKPGISNLMTILGAITGDGLDKIESNFSGKDYGVFKQAVADAVTNLLTPIQERFQTLYNSTEVDNYLMAGAANAKSVASKKLNKVKNLVGLNYRRK
jgi:tryptophanyl-tRNA synthetase